MAEASSVFKSAAETSLLALRTSSNPLPQSFTKTRAPGAKAETVESFKSSLDLSLREFLSNGDLIEATRCLLELGTPQYHYQIVKRGVTLAMDKAGREREMVALLLSTLHVRGVLTSAQAHEGFAAPLESIDDLVIDIPDAPDLVSHFLADSHLDGTLLLRQLDELGGRFAPQPAATAVLRQARSRVLQKAALLIDVELGRALFDKVSSLPLRTLEDRPSNYWNSLFRDADTVRNMFSGPTAVLAAELPFIPIFIVIVLSLPNPSPGFWSSLSRSF